MKYNPITEDCPLKHTPFRSCVVPRPIAWISTISKDGEANLAPFSQSGILTFDPPMVMFAANHYPDGKRKDSAINAEQTGWFVWNMATSDLKDAMNISAKIVPPSVDEFEEAGLKKVKSDYSEAPMVAQSPIHLECKYISTHTVQGASELGTVDVIYGEVHKIHIADEFLNKDGLVDIPKVKPLTRMGYIDYAVVEESFSMRIPDSPDVMASIMAGSE